LQQLLFWLNQGLAMRICFCHRLPERSFFFKGKQFPLCARCTGMIVGAMVGFFLVSIKVLFGQLLNIALMVPLIIDGTTQALKIRESSNKLRFLTGMLFSVGFAQLCFQISAFILRSLVLAAPR
jgi:uncharacterized membrane protein